MEEDEAKDKGNRLFKQGDYVGAVAAYSTVYLELKDHDLASHRTLYFALLTNRALCYLSTKKWELCRKDCNAALAIDQTNAKAWYRRALALHQLNQIKKAIQDLKQLLTLEPKNGRAEKLARSLILEYNSPTHQLVHSHPNRAVRLLSDRFAKGVISLLPDHFKVLDTWTGV